MISSPFKSKMKKKQNEKKIHVFNANIAVHKSTHCRLDVAIVTNCRSSSNSSEKPPKTFAMA